MQDAEGSARARALGHVDRQRRRVCVAVTEGRCHHDTRVAHCTLMTTYRLVYDVARAGFPAWPVVLWGIAAGVAGAALLGLAPRSSRAARVSVSRVSRWAGTSVAGSSAAFRRPGRIACSE